MLHLLSLLRWVDPKLRQGRQCWGRSRRWRSWWVWQCKTWQERNLVHLFSRLLCEVFQDAGWGLWETGCGSQPLKRFLRLTFPSSSPTSPLPGGIAHCNQDDFWKIPPLSKKCPFLWNKRRNFWIKYYIIICLFVCWWFGWLPLHELLTGWIVYLQKCRRTNKNSFEEKRQK